MLLLRQASERGVVKFWLGSHRANWLEQEPDLFVSRRVLFERKKLPVAIGPWALDSGGFTELALFGGWVTPAVQYIQDVLRFEREIGNLQWVAPQDWMCEPFLIEKTGGSVAVHQQMTIENFLRLRDALGELVIPVLQGWTQDDYHNCWGLYEENGVALEDEPLVGVGSVCRRQSTQEAARIFRSLSPLKLHGFGVKTSGLQVYADALTSADSMAWSYRARRDHPLPCCTHKSCANCLRYARRWRDRVEQALGQTRLEFA